MPISSIDAGKTLCELSNWKTSNLRLQKLLYISHMYHIGLTGKDLINEDFEAWRHGPVERKLYFYCKGYGSGYIPDIFLSYEGAKEKTTELFVLQAMHEATYKLKDYMLVSFTHWKEGAWYKVFKKDKPKGYIITRELIEDEYKKRRQEDKNI